VYVFAGVRALLVVPFSVGPPGNAVAALLWVS
jgi:hypothetical protein